MSFWRRRQANIGQHQHLETQILSEAGSPDTTLEDRVTALEESGGGGSDWHVFSVGHDLTEIITVGETTWRGLVIPLDFVAGDMFDTVFWTVTEGYSRDGTPIAANSMGIFIGTLSEAQERLGVTGASVMPSQPGDLGGSLPGALGVSVTIFGTNGQPGFVITDESFKIFVVDDPVGADFDAGAGTIWIRKLSGA